MTHEPDDSWRHEIFEKIGAHIVVIRRVYSFSDVMQEGSGPKTSILSRGSSEIENLERMKKGVTFGMIRRILTDSIESEQER